MKRLLVSAVLALAPVGAGRAPWPPRAEQLSPSALAFPAAFTARPDGSRILYGERYTGRIRWLDPTTGMSTPFFTVPNVAGDGDQGLLGLALPPSYPSDSRVWAFVTRTVSGTAEEPASADPGGWQRLHGHSQPADRHEPRRRPHHVRPRREALHRRRIHRQKGPGPGPVQPGGKGAAAEPRRHRALQQPQRGKPDHRLRDPQLLRLHVRSPSRGTCGLPTTARNATTSST